MEFLKYTSILFELSDSYTAAIFKPYFFLTSFSKNVDNVFTNLILFTLITIGGW